MTAMTYTMSKNYDALYDLLCAGGEAFCYVDNDFRDGMTPCRDAARVRRLAAWRIVVGVRGCGYGDVHPLDREKHSTERDALKSECTRLNLEWLAPVDLAGVLEAGDKMELALMRNERYTEDGELDLPLNSKDVELSNAWTTATSQFRK